MIIAGKWPIIIIIIVNGFTRLKAPYRRIVNVVPGGSILAGSPPVIGIPMPRYSVVKLFLQLLMNLCIRPTSWEPESSGSAAKAQRYGGFILIMPSAEILNGSLITYEPFTNKFKSSTLNHESLTSDHQLAPLMTYHYWFYKTHCTKKNDVITFTIPKI